MKVKELIKKLKSCPQNLEVLINIPYIENSHLIEKVNHIVGGCDGSLEPYIAIESKEQI